MAKFSSQFAISSLLILSIFANAWIAISADHTNDMPELLVPIEVTSERNLGFINDQFSGDYRGVGLVTKLYIPGGFEPPNFNPYSAELLLLVEGTLHVGFIDTENKLYKSTLHAGDMFLFPSGLVNFKSNPFNSPQARTVSVFGGFTGKVDLPRILLSSGIDDGILEQSFKTDQATIDKFRAGLGYST